MTLVPEHMMPLHTSDGGILCGDCLRVIGDEEFATEINPPGGYGQRQVLVCDKCMESGRWDHWINRHWPDWPNHRDHRR